MKPPKRLRSAPVRYDTGPLRLTWTTREKLELLRCLKSQKNKKDPQPMVKGRSPGEISSYISWLRGRTAREAVQTEYERWLQQRKTKDTDKPALIELWTDLAFRMSQPAEEALTSAFSQILTIAATEPVSLQHSIPSKIPMGTSNQDLTGIQGHVPLGCTSQNKPSSEQGSESIGAMTDASEKGTADGLKDLDFQKIYKYLSKIARGEELPKLSELESAVLLRLLDSLPDELLNLDIKPLGEYLQQSCSRLNSQPDDQEPATSDESRTETQWKDLGFCPLNPFQIPLQFLYRKEPE
ncbi:snRNA-activating protein complex subunit 2 [Bombina bombina]|uniref:snRNA-activating protein complex subunit 2 n=1 Tax=Bombina bombina TaxID=8345 RepID=UPI00235B1075|nr:snRNA-activating protein complex subunit 2 [Bombina bombina]XP_053574250.1 snRNA-activating protein complex subunit 2 [Bombina bombina]